MPESGYRLLAQILASYLASVAEPQAVAESAGLAWGRYVSEKPQPFAAVSADEATQKVVQLFSELGFMREVVGEPGELNVLLHHCPFREVAQSNQQVVCAVHLGMLKGALAEMGAPLEATRLGALRPANPLRRTPAVATGTSTRPACHGSRIVPDSMGPSALAARPAARGLAAMGVQYPEQKAQ